MCRAGGHHLDAQSVEALDEVVGELFDVPGDAMRLEFQDDREAGGQSDGTWIGSRSADLPGKGVVGELILPQREEIGWVKDSPQVRPGA
ncbi:hypothetical protein GCM10010493_75540 [Streptomyces lavendulae subsp. grasserius]